MSKTPDFKMVDFDGSGNYVTGDCNLKCQLLLNEIEYSEVKKGSSGGCFTIDSPLFTINYATNVYYFNNKQAIVLKNKIHTSLYPRHTGIIGELILQAKSRNNNELLIFIPIYQTNRNNENGKMVKSFMDPDSNGEKRVMKLFPKDTKYFSSKNTLENEKVKTNIVVFIGSSIKMTWETLQEIGNAGSGTVDVLTKLLNYKLSTFNKTSTTDLITETAEIFKNENGISSGKNNVSIIDCQPVDDNGILLIDRERGLGRGGIELTSNLSSLQEKYLAGDTAQIVIGVALVFMVATLLRSASNIMGKS
jgi:hypothetical protein